MAKMKVGVVGLGMMGLTHMDVYSQRDDVELYAIADMDPDRLSGKTQAAGNVEGMAQGGIDYDSLKKYSDGMDLINDPEIDIIDLCLPTPLHVKFGKAALASGKHVLMEKPLARNYADALELVQAGEESEGMTMPAMCMRFWPGWDWLKKTVDDAVYGKVKGAHFRRVASHPGGFYCDGQASGGAALDLHIHDTDFIQFLFGMPKAVASTGYSQVTDAIDHITTIYTYDDVPLVTAEGAWCMTPGFPFTMQYTVHFENATAVFDLAADDTLLVYEEGKDPQPIELSPTMGYTYEIEYFLDCINSETEPDIVTLQDAANAVQIVEAEIGSIISGNKIDL
jgi:predicted dehydrogenase